MKTFLLVVACVLISASVAAFIWGGMAAENRYGRAFVKGHVGWELPDRPWVGAMAFLGTDSVALTQDGEFSFAALPGRYHLKICCSTRFQAIEREVVVGKDDVQVDLKPTPLTEIPVTLTVRGGAEVPYGFLISASLAGSNVVDRVSTPVDGKFQFHLLEGDWEIKMENLPEQYKNVSVFWGDQKVIDRKFTLAKGAAPLPLQISVQ